MDVDVDVDVDEVRGGVAVASVDAGAVSGGASGIVATATVVRESDFGSNDNSFQVRTHLGGILQPGDTALGYDMAHVVHSSALESLVGPLVENSQDIILVRKTYPDALKNKSKNKRKSKSKGERSSSWRSGGGEDGGATRDRTSRRAEASSQAMVDADFELYLQEEADEDELLFEEGLEEGLEEESGGDEVAGGSDRDDDCEEGGSLGWS